MILPFEQTDFRGLAHALKKQSQSRHEKALIASALKAFVGLAPCHSLGKLLERESIREVCWRISLKARPVLCIGSHSAISSVYNYSRRRTEPGSSDLGDSADRGLPPVPPMPGHTHQGPAVER